MFEYRDPSWFRLAPGGGETQIVVGIHGVDTLVRVRCDELTETFGNGPHVDCLALARSRHPWLGNAIARYLDGDLRRREADGSILLRARDLIA